MRGWHSWGLLALLGLISLVGHAEQRARFGDWELHYIVVPSTFPNAAVAANYGIVRARNRSFLNLTLLDASKVAQRAQINGSFKNLLGQSQPLNFREISFVVRLHGCSQQKQGRSRDAQTQFHLVVLLLKIG